MQKGKDAYWEDKNFVPNHHLLGDENLDTRKRYYVTVTCLDDVVANSRQEAIHLMYRKYLKKKGLDCVDVSINEVEELE